MRIERPATIEMIAARNLFNVTIIGDGTAGVMHMLVTYTENRFPQHYCPTVVDSPICDVLIDGTMVRLKLWPAPGQEECKQFRSLSYANTDCFILCYSIEDRASFINLLSHWYAEIRDYTESVPIVLVGTKCDLRISNSDEFVSHAEGEQLKKQIGATIFIECSAKTRKNLDKVFHEAARAVIQKEAAKAHKKSKCLVQ